MTSGRPAPRRCRGRSAFSKHTARRQHCDSRPGYTQQHMPASRAASHAPLCPRACPARSSTILCTASPRPPRGGATFRRRTRQAAAHSGRPTAGAGWYHHSTHLNEQATATKGAKRLQPPPRARGCVCLNAPPATAPRVCGGCVVRTSGGVGGGCSRHERSQPEHSPPPRHPRSG